MTQGNQYAANFRDLLVYEKARSVAKDIFTLSKRFPKEEMYSLTDQGRSSSRSVGAQIAEAWGKRRYEKSFVSKLTDADAEQYETQHWIETALDCAYLTEKEARELIDRLAEIGRMLNGMIEKADSFCGTRATTLREEMAEYLVHADE